jgi:quercetin dioxygenase-like cupin family protein
VKHWDIAALEVAPHAPEIISSTGDSRAIVLELPAGERLQEHQVHERAWVLVAGGEVEASSGGESVTVAAGTLLEFDPAERHEVVARTLSRLLILLTPWPGDGHPGAMTLDQKRDAVTSARARARKE